MLLYAMDICLHIWISSRTERKEAVDGAQETPDIPPKHRCQFHLDWQAILAFSSFEIFDVLSVAFFHWLASATHRQDS